MNVIAVIPGLAPGLVAILPQLLLLVTVTMTLLVSPRTWWRGFLLCARHPLRALSTAALLALLVLGVRELVALIPEARPGAEIPMRVAGLAIGDGRASGDRSTGPGPVSLPEVRLIDLPLPTDANELCGFGDHALVLHGERRLVSCLDPAGPRLLWTRELEGEVVVGPIGFERVDESKPSIRGERSVLVITANPGAGTILVLDADDGTMRSRRDLPGRPRSAGALIDDRLVVALEGSIACFSLSDSGEPRPLWTRDRSPTEVVSLVGDACGRYFVLDSESLAVGELGDGASRTLASLEGESPAGLAAHSGLVYVLTTSGKEAARLRCFDPALLDSKPSSGAAIEAPGPLRWSTPTPRPLGGEFFVASYGIVLTFRDRLEIRDRMTGRPTRSLAFDAPCVAPAAGGRFACYALLSDRTVLRYSPALERVQWRVACPGPESAPSESPRLEEEGAVAVLAVGERLLVGLSDQFYGLAEAERSGALAWSHWRGTPSRCGTLDGSQLPLAAALRWKSARAGAVDPTVLPLADGWLAVEADSGATRLTRLDDAGQARSTAEMPGKPRGFVIQDGRVFVASEDPDSGAHVQALAVDPVRGDEAVLWTLWSVPVPSLGSDADADAVALAASRELVIVASVSGLRALSVFDGSRRWEASEIRAAASPLIVRDRVFAGERRQEGRAGDESRTFAALALGSGDGIWERSEIGWDWGPASLLDDVLFIPVTIGDRDARVLCLDASDGSTRWEYRTEGDRVVPPVAAAEDQVVFRLRSGTTVVLSAKGEELRRIDASRSGPVPRRVVPPIVGLGSLVLADGKMVRCVDSLTFDSVWELELPAPVQGLTLDGDEILAVTKETLFCFGAVE